MFDAFDLPQLAEGLAWALMPGDVTIFLAIVEAPLPGDYNDDGTVDAADYVVWRKNAGTNNVLPNDEIGGMIGPAHYTQWRTHFGQSAGGGSGSASSREAAVPEPRTMFVLLLAGVCLSVRRLRRIAAASV